MIYGCRLLHSTVLRKLSIVTTVTDCDSLIRGDQGPPNFCLHRVARMLRPALVI